MVKPTHEDKTRELDTKILFKRSINTNFTNSTCSGASQLVTKSGYLQIKKNSDGNKLKRDLSIETDACILRRYYKVKRHRMSNQGSSGVSKYSTVVDTEIETIEEFPDTSACGDNEITEERSSHPIDIEALMVANLKSLLGKWIQKNLLYNKDTQNKLDNVLDSILHKLDSKIVHKTSSDSTYVIHKEEQKQQVKNKKIATSSMTCQYCKSCRGKIQTSSAISRRDSSTLTIPSNYKGIRIISTLSMPRSFHNSKLDQRKSINSLMYKLRKMKRRNVILSINKSNKLQNSSTFDIIAISTKSLTRRCAHCDSSMKKKRHIVLLRKPFFRKSSNSMNNIKQDKTKAKFEDTDEMSSLLKSIYTTSIDKNVQFDSKNDNFTMTDNISEEFSKHSVSQITLHNKVCPEALTENVKFINENKPFDSFVKNTENDQLPSHPQSAPSEFESNSCKNTKLIQRKKYNSRRRHLFCHTFLHHYSKFNNVYNKKFTYLYKKTNNPLQGREFVKYCRNIFRYVTEQDLNKNIKVDVRINIFPMLEPRTKDASTDISNQALETYNMTDSPSLLYEVDNIGSNTIDSQPYMQPNTILDIEYEGDPTISSSHCTAEIIPLLDGAVSQAKYIFNDNSGEKTEVKSDVVTGNTSQLGILQEISELRAVIKDLAITAEKLVNEQIKKKAVKTNAETHFSLKMSNDYALNTRYKTDLIQKNPSKTTQVSIEFEKNQVQSDMVKESKKKDTFDYYNRLTKKSTSYRIIDSESLLKVTDMTSKGNDVNEYNRRFADEALTCSLPKSRSLFELTSDRNKKLIAFFCDNYVNPKVTCNIRDSRSTAPSPCKSSKTSTKSKKWRFWSKKSSKCDTKCPYSSTCQSPPTIPLPMPCPDAGGYSSTLSCHSMNSIIDEEDEVVCKLQRRGMGFGEGCVYCLLLWIPVVIILIVFYSYVLRDSAPTIPANRTTTPVPTTKRYYDPYYAEEPRRGILKNNSSNFYLKLSDLGF